MGKISQYNSDAAPALLDYLLGDSASGPNTVRFTIQNLINTFFANIPNNTVKSPALALSAALDSVNGVKTLANAGNAGGTMYYINIGGLKILWGLTGSVALSAANYESYGVTFPSGFFSAIQTIFGNMSTSGTAQSNSNMAAQSVSTSGFTLVTFGGSAATASQFGYIVIGT